MKAPDGSRKIAEVPLQLPHEVLDFLMRECDLPMSNPAMTTYWNHLESVQDEVAVTSRRFRACLDKPACPLGMHGDDAAMGLVSGAHEKITGIFLSLPLFRPRATRLSRFMLCSIENQLIWSLEETVYPLLERIVASLNRCTEIGVASRRFILTELRGDQSWFRYLFRFKSYWKANNVCCRCEASAKDPGRTYVSYDGWVPSSRSTSTFLAEELPDPLCPLVAYYSTISKLQQFTKQTGPV